MRVLITGANGHLGANVARALLKHGYEVIPFVRQNADLRGLNGLGLEYRYGDVMDQQSLIAAAEGCDVLIHMAATYRYWATDPQEILQPALIGTRNAMSAAKEAGIGRVVYTSTIWAVGVGKCPEEIRTPTDWNEDARNPYAVAKTQAEREAWRMADELGLEMISICPSGLLGPYDYRITPSTDVIRGLINGTTPVYKGGLSYVDIGKVAEIHARAVEMGKVGERYIAAGENMLVSKYGEIITKLTGSKPPHIPGGRIALQTVAALAEMGSALTKSAPLITRALADEIGDRYMYYDSEKTYRTLASPQGMQKI
jgi:dihydroflavonol-4-reductase